MDCFVSQGLYIHVNNWNGKWHLTTGEVQAFMFCAFEKTEWSVFEVYMKFDKFGALNLRSHRHHIVNL